MDNFKVKCRSCQNGKVIFHKTSLLCPTCNGAGYVKAEIMNTLIDSVFTCEHCGADRIHYRLYGYRCPNRCEDERI